MPRGSVIRKLPRSPSRVAPGLGQIPTITDPRLRHILRQLADRISAQDQTLQNLDTFALKAGSPVNAYGQRVMNVGTPQVRDDAVPLWYLRKFVAEQALFRSEGGGSGDGDGDGDLSGGGTPTVPFPNLLGDVQAYAASHPTELANSCLAQGGTWAYFDGLVAYLRGIDPRVGYLAQRGVLSDTAEDAVAYWHGPMPPIDAGPDIYVADVISKHCPGPGDVVGPAWGQVAVAGGLWLQNRS